MSLETFLNSIGYKSKGLREFSDKMPDPPVKVKLPPQGQEFQFWNDLSVTTMSCAETVMRQQVRNL